MRHFKWLGAVLLFSLVAVLQAQDPVYRVSVNVPVVALDAVVKDSNSRPVINLTQADFQIYEDGVLQEIKYFEPAESSRSVLLLFDVTGVMDSQKSFMEQSMTAYFANMRPQDRVGVGAIGPELEMLMSLRKTEPGKPFKVKLPPEKMGSNLYESLDMAARRFGKEDTRRAIIAMTDGRETFLFNETKRLGVVPDGTNDLDFKGRVTAARKRGVPYYFIALDTDPRYLGQYDVEYAFFKNPDGYRRSSEYSNGRRSPTIAEDFLAGVKLRMERLAEATGGRVVYPKSLAEVVSFFDRISKELGHSYSMGYIPKASLEDGKEHKIEIRTKNGYTVEQSRTTYGGLK